MQEILGVLSKSRFTEYLVRENGLAEHGLEHWVLRPGMLFGAPDKWWGDHGKRSVPHEGLDLWLYRDQHLLIHRLHVGTAIPAMYDGAVVRMLGDFLGTSVVVEHRLPQGDAVFYTIYGHTIPRDGLDINQSVHEGEIIARLADATRSKDDALPHLHVSLGWTRSVIAYHSLDWGTIPQTLTLLDPLPVVGWPYVLEPA